MLSPDGELHHYALEGDDDAFTLVRVPSSFSRFPPTTRILQQAATICVATDDDQLVCAEEGDDDARIREL